MKLLLDTVEELSEQFVVAFDSCRMLTRCLRLDLCRQAIKPLPHLFEVEACFTIRNNESWRSEVLDSRLMNGSDDGLRRLVWEYGRDRKTNRFINDMGDHDVALEHNVPLNAFVELRCESR